MFGSSSSPLCSFCKNVDETILHPFYECNITKVLWKSLISYFDKSLNLPFLSPQIAFLGFTDTYCNDILLKNHILLLFKIYVYNSRNNKKISLKNLIRNVTKVKSIEKEIAAKNEKNLCCITKSGKKLKTGKRKMSVSLIIHVVGGGIFLLRNICCYFVFLSLFFLLLLLLLFVLVFFSLFFVYVCVIIFCVSFALIFFSLFFVCVCVIIFCGSFVFFILMLFN